MSPLGRRLPRELRHNLGKYLGLFLLISLTIAMVTGYLVAARSIQRVIADTRASSNVEDFAFTTQFEASDEALDAVERVRSGCKVHRNFYAELPLSAGPSVNDVTVRLYENRSEVDLASYVEGHAPQATDEIALSRTFCENRCLSVGDTVSVNGRDLTICGLVSLPDYQALIRKNTDLLFDGQGFSVAQVTPEAFDELAESVVYHYSVVLDERDMPLVDRTDYETDAYNALEAHGATVSSLVDRDANQALAYADDDIEGDQLGWTVMCGLLLVISAFVFVVLTDATIEQESPVIGMLLASGYRKGELVRHYLVLPTLVGVLAAIVGNAVGYARLVDVMSGLYYRSYDLPPFRAYFSFEVLCMTTVVPVVMLVAITWIGVRRKLGATPLAFLRHEIGHRSRRSTASLPEGWSFPTRFRVRVFLRNASHFAVLFVGIMFSTLLLLFGLCMLPMIRHYADELERSVPAGHVYYLKAPLEVDVTEAQRDAAEAADELADFEDPERDLSSADYLRLVSRAQSIASDARVLSGHPLNTRENSSVVIDDAEKFSTVSLEVKRLRADSSEDVAIYGVPVSSSYWKFDVSGGKVVVGTGLAEKCGLAVGKQATFTNKYTGDSYAISPDVIAGEPTDTNVYMSRETYAEIFGTDPDDFDGYASDKTLNLNERYVASEMTPSQMSAIADQMETSMGSIMTMMLCIAVPISIVLIYLLTKTVIDRSSRYISYMKVFGYHDGEIQGLYVRSITITVLASLVLSLPLVIWLVELLMKTWLAEYSGNIELWLPPSTLAQAIAIGALSYAVVALAHVARVRHVSLAEALKVQE
ncbi:ABC transporter permease [Olsenella uli]|uniref:ABC transporter permease n=1 Tax=Olsenella uli TaxID=133926 RepID=UPI00325FBB82